MRTALISGASTGIGRATALRLARSGWRVLAGVRAIEAGAALSQELSLNPGAGELIPVMLDITDEGEIAQAGEALAEHVAGGGLDALINNAGTGTGGPLELLAMSDVRAQFEVNLFGHIALTQALLGELRSAKGRIVLVSSIGGRVAVPFSAPYAASKHALEAVGDCLRSELHSSGIGVTLVEPGSVRTAIWDKSRKSAEGLVVPDGLQAEYGHVRAAMDAALRRTAQRGVPAEKIAAVIERALNARRMRTRYLIGADARAMVTARALLPNRVFDSIVRRSLGV